MPDKNRRRNRDMSDLRLPEVEQAISRANQVLVAAANIFKTERDVLIALSKGNNKRGKGGKKDVKIVLDHTRMIVGTSTGHQLDKQRELFLDCFNKLLPEEATQDLQVAAQRLLELFALSEKAESDAKEG